MAILIKGVLVLSMMGIKDCDFKITFKRLHSVCTQQTHGVRESVAKNACLKRKHHELIVVVIPIMAVVIFNSLTICSYEVSAALRHF
jgi:hypothetical protein